MRAAKMGKPSSSALQRDVDNWAMCNVVKARVHLFGLFKNETRRGIKKFMPRGRESACLIQGILCVHSHYMYAPSQLAHTYALFLGSYPNANPYIVS